MPKSRRTASAKPLRSVSWEGGLDDGRLAILDLEAMPSSCACRSLGDLDEVVQAIDGRSVAGSAAPIAAAFGVVLHLAAKAGDAAPATTLAKELARALKALAGTGACCLKPVLDRIAACYQRHARLLTAKEMCARLLMEAKRIHREDSERCARIARNGAKLLPAGGVLTHGHTGALSSGGMGTALGCIVQAHRNGKRLAVYATESRPLLDGARLTTAELMAAGVPVTLCCDGTAASLMAGKRIRAVVIGAKTIFANGDVCAAPGGYALAVLAHHHGIPFHVAAPSTAFAPKLKNGGRCTICERDADEVRQPRGNLASPAAVPVANPCCDTIPAHLLTTIVTDKGVIHTPMAETVAVLAG